MYLEKKMNLPMLGMLFRADNSVLPRFYRFLLRNYELFL